MHFELTEERRMLANTLDRYLREQYAFGTRQAIAASAAGFSLDKWHDFAELGATAALFDESCGGMGGSGQDIVIVFEALGRVLALEPLAGALMAGRVLAGCAPQERTRLQALLEGEHAITLLAHEEADSGADASRVALAAESTSDGWRLRGSKCVVPQAQGADAFVVSARTGGAPGERHGLSLFLIPANTPGLKLRTYPLIDGGRGADLSFQDVQVSSQALLGTGATALDVLEEALSAGLLALCAESLGAMEVVKAATLDYLRTRRQFGVPIGSFQALQHRMVDLLLEIEQARSAVANAAVALHGPRSHRERAVSAAKYTVGRVGAHVAEEAIQLHGAIGMTWELPMPHYAKRLVMIDHQHGDEDQHLARFIELGRASLG